MKNNNHLLKILLYGTILIVLTAAGILSYNYLHNANEDKNTTTQLNIDDVSQAILDRNEEIYSKYINDGADLSFAFTEGREKGRTPLEVLIDAGELEYAKKIMDNGFDLSKVDNNHMDTITSVLAYNENHSDMEYLNNIISDLIDQVQEEINSADTSGFSLLINAIESDNETIVKKILTLDNLDINAVYDEETALTYALRNGDDLEFIQVLVNRGADVNFKGEDGYTPLMYAIMNTRIDTLEYLLTVPNIKINEVNDYGQTALHLCVEYTNVEAVDILLQIPTIDTTIEYYIKGIAYTPKEFAEYMATRRPEIEDFSIIANKF